MFRRIVNGIINFFCERDKSLEDMLIDCCNPNLLKVMFIDDQTLRRYEPLTDVECIEIGNYCGVHGTVISHETLSYFDVLVEGVVERQRERWWIYNVTSDYVQSEIKNNRVDIIEVRKKNYHIYLVELHVSRERMRFFEAALQRYGQKKRPVLVVSSQQ